MAAHGRAHSQWAARRPALRLHEAEPLQFCTTLVPPSCMVRLQACCVAEPLQLCAMLVAHCCHRVKTAVPLRGRARSCYTCTAALALDLCLSADVSVACI